MDKIQIIRSNRKTLTLQIRKDLSIIVRAPMRASNARIDEFVKSNENWIKKHLEIIKNRNLSEAQKQPLPAFTDDEIKGLKTRAATEILPKVAFYANKIGVKYKNATFKAQLSRWGSCSAKGNLNFNCVLALCPSEVIEYVIIHELCHLIHLNHSSAFWAVVAKHCPDYKTRRRWLKTDGNELIKRLRIKR